MKTIPTALLMLVMSITSCEPTVEDATNANSSTASDTSEDDGGSGSLAIDPCSEEYAGDSSCGETVSAKLDTTITVLSDVSSNYTPGALAIDESATTLRLQGDGGDDDNPCQDSDGNNLTFESCQPNLLKVYLMLGRMPLDIAQELLSHIKPLIVSAIDRDTLKGTHNNTDSSGPEKIEFDIVDSERFKIIVYDGDMRLYLSLDGEGSIDLKMRMTEDEQGGKPGLAHATMTYTDDAEWTTTNKMVFDECPAEGGGPRVIAVNVHKEDVIWQGKAMLFDSPQSICETSDSPGHAGWYTDFVGDATDTTASVYFFPADKDPREVADVEVYNLPSLCTNLPQHQFCGGGQGQSLALLEVTQEQCTKCSPGGEWADNYDQCIGVSSTACQALMSQQSGGGGGDGGNNWLPSDLTPFTNPYCMTPGETPTWNGACSSGDARITTPTYSAASNWIDPKDDLIEAEVCFPKDLDNLTTCAVFQ